MDHQTFFEINDNYTYFLYFIFSVDNSLYIMLCVYLNGNDRFHRRHGNAELLTRYIYLVSQYQT